MSLVHWWPLNGDAQDKITASVLTNSGGTFIEDGKIGSSYSIKRTTGRGLQGPFSQTISNNEFSIALWIRLHSDWSNAYNQVFTIGNNSTAWTAQRATILIKNDKKVYFVLSDGSSYVSTLGARSDALDLNIWYHITATFYNQQAKLYINGQPATGMPTYITSFLPNFLTSTIIAIGGNSSEVGNCDINDVRVYDHELSLTEIQELKKALVIHYTFNDLSPLSICNETGLIQPSAITDLTFSNQSKIGIYSGFFNKATTCIDTPMIKPNMFTDNYTLSFWVYPNTNERAIYFGDYLTDNCMNLNFERRANDGALRYYHAGSPNQYFNTITAPINEWTMITIAYEPGKMKIYKNGDQNSAVIFEHTATLTKTQGIMRIGRDSRSNDNTPFGGYMNDFRLYATLLSDAEVKELYDCGGRISNLGDAATGSFIEGESAIQINKNHTIDSNEIIEQDEAKASFKKNGTIFARQIIET